MDTALQYDRLQFAVTATFHYLFPQLTMGLALLLVYLRTRDLLSEGTIITRSRDSGPASLR